MNTHNGAHLRTAEEEVGIVGGWFGTVSSGGWCVTVLGREGAVAVSIGGWFCEISGGRGATQVRVEDGVTSQAQEFVDIVECEDASVVVHEHREIQLGGQDIKRDVTIKQVAGSLGNSVASGLETSIMIVSKPSVVQLASGPMDQLDRGPDEHLRSGPLEVRRSDNNLVFEDNVLWPSDGFTFESNSNKSLKAKAGMEEAC
ncbi:hypothetical protein QYF36_010191 [Acer negundo]|nr:hypothetical protein QYF36_010191 [Acer negundo]